MTETDIRPKSEGNKEMSDNSEREIGISYGLFATSDGEVFSGGGDMPRDEFVDFLAEEFAKYVKGLTDENPHRTIVFILETELSGDSRMAWIYHTEKHHPLAPILNFIGRESSRISQWCWSKASEGKWEKTTCPLPPWAEEDEVKRARGDRVET